MLQLVPKHPAKVHKISKISLLTLLRYTFKYEHYILYVYKIHIVTVTVIKKNTVIIFFIYFYEDRKYGSYNYVTFKRNARWWSISVKSRNIIK